MEEQIKNALLEAIWICRWNKDKTALSAVLSIEESDKICEDITTELYKAGYKIIQREDVLTCEHEKRMVESDIFKTDYFCHKCGLHNYEITK